MKAVFKYLLHVLKLIVTLGVPAYKEVAKAQRERDSLIVGINTLINEAKIAKDVYKQTGKAGVIETFTDPDRMKRILASAQTVYGSYHDIKALIKKMQNNGDIKKVE